jgi:hypothetical protein
MVIDDEVGAMSKGVVMDYLEYIQYMHVGANRNDEYA